MPITSETDIRWCERCQRKAATSFCEVWLCGSCYQRLHPRDPYDGHLVHLTRGEARPEDKGNLEPWMPRERLRSRDPHRTG